MDKGLNDTRELNIVDNMLDKWDKIIKYEEDNKAEEVKNFELAVRGWVINNQIEKRVKFNKKITIGIKTSKSRDYVEGKVISLKGLEELREIRNFYKILEGKLELEKDDVIEIKSIKVKIRG